MKKTKSESNKTRMYLMDAALEVFFQNGVTRSSLEAVARQAQVTRGAVYWHFKNKEDIFEALFEVCLSDFYEEFSEETLREQKDNIWSYMESRLSLIFQRLIEDDRLRKFVIVLHSKCEQTHKNNSITELANSFHRRCNELFYLALELCRDNQKLPNDIDLERAAIFLSSNIKGLIHLWAFNPDSIDLMKQANPSLSATLFALQNSPALRLPATQNQ